MTIKDIIEKLEEDVEYYFNRIAPTYPATKYIIDLIDWIKSNE